MNTQQLQEAGFSNDEINSYLGTKSSLKLKEAGFSDEEINNYVPIKKESYLSQFGKGIVGTGEATIKLGGDIVKFIPTGILEGVMALAPEGTTINDIARSIQEPIQKGLTYEPQTETGKALSGIVEWPFKKFDEWGDSVADFIIEGTKNNPYLNPETRAILSTTVGGAIKFLPYSLGLKAAFKGPKPLKIITDRKVFEEINKPVEGLTLEPDIGVAGKEPSITLDQLKSSTNLADYVTKRPEIHLEEVTKYAKELKPEEVKPTEVKPEMKVEGVKPSEIPHIGEIQELRDMVKRGEPGSKTFTSTRTENLIIGGFGSSYPAFMRNKGWTQKEVLRSIDKGLEGKKLGSREQKIWDAVNEEAKGIYGDRLEEQHIFEERKALFNADPEFLKEDTFKNLTKSIDDEIIGMKEEWREQGYSESEINKFVTEVEKDIEVKAESPNIESIKTDLTEPTPEVTKPPTSKPELSPTQKGQYKLPGVKQGLEIKGGKEVTPTLEGTPLGEAGKKAEREKIQPGFEFQSTILPGVKEFIEQDIVPKAQQLGTGLKDTWEGFKHLASPRSGVSREILDTIMKKKGGLDKATSLLEATTRDVERTMEKWSKQEQIDFFDRIKKGEPEINPQRQQMQDMLRTMDDGLYDALQQVKPSMPWIENHFRVLYKTVPKSLEEGIKGIFRRPLEGGKGYFKQHTLADLSEGIALGGEPITYNPMRMFRYHYADVMKYITTQKMWEELGDIGAREFVRFGKKPPEGFVRLNDRIANVYFKVEEGLIHAGEWYVEEGAARLLNNYMSRDLIREAAIGRGLMWIKNSTTAIELGFFNTFHGTFEALEAVASSIGHGSRTIWNEGISGRNFDAIIKGSEEIIKAPYAPIERARIGGGFVRYFENKGEFLKTTRGNKFIKQFPDVETLIDDLFTGGMKNFGMHEDYRIGSIQTFKENLSSNNYIGAAIRSIPAFNEVVMKPLFNIYIPRLKVGMWAKEYSAELARRSGDIASGKITRSELARDIWDFVENRFGEMNFDNLFWDRTFKTGLQALIRSVTWKLGNIKLFGKAPIEQAKEFYNAFQERRIPELAQEMAWVWGIAVTHAAISSIVQTVFTGKPPSEFKDFFWPKVDKEGNRVSPATYMRDLFSLISSPIKYVSHSMAGYIGRFIEVLNNKDFYGVQVHDPEEDWIQQRIDDLIHMVPTPFGISSMLRLHEQGLPLERSIIANFGFTKAPYYIEQSEAEQKAGELLQNYILARPRTKEEFERAMVRKQYAQEIQKSLKDKPQDLAGIIKKMATDIETKKLSMDDIDKIKGRLREPLEGKTLRLSLSDGFKVWKVASPEEKIKLKNIIIGKIERMRDIEELGRLKPQIDEFINEIKGGLK